MEDPSSISLSSLPSTASSAATSTAASTVALSGRRAAASSSSTQSPLVLMKSRKNSMPFAEITEGQYAQFITLSNASVDETPAQGVSTYVRAMRKSCLFSVVKDHTDPIFGFAPARIVEKSSQKVLLTVDQKPNLIALVAAKYKDEQFPVGKCLQLIQRQYYGFPLLELRQRVIIALDALNAGEQREDGVNEAVSATIDATSADAHITAHESVSTPTQPLQRADEQKTPFTKTRGGAPVVPDDRYELMLQVLRKEVRLSKLVTDNAIREWIRNRIHKVKYEAVEWEGDEHLNAGWRIVEISTGRIVPRTSEANEIRRKYHALTDENVFAASQLADTLANKFVGLTFLPNNGKLTGAAAKNVTPRPPPPTRIAFPTKPKVQGCRPMQYVQVDMVDMDGSDYGERCYNKMLVVTDLYSRYVFGRALSDTTDQSLVVRHLMDIFGAFGPPEAYRTFTNKNMVAECVADVAKLFKISIKSVGSGNMSHYALRRAIYRRAEVEIGSRERWVEALPFAVIEVNQQPCRVFDWKLSPFEVMFGRRAWKAQRGLPPWIDPETKDNSDNEGDAENEHNRAARAIAGEQPADGKSPTKSELVRGPGRVAKEAASISGMSELNSVRKGVDAILKNGYAKPEDDDDTQTPATGILFKVGDRCYIRNLGIKEFAKFSTKKAAPRYFRALVAEVDLSDKDFPYRVHFWERTEIEDTAPLSMWPDETAPDLWIGPYDITGENATMNRLRSVRAIRKTQVDMSRRKQCQCNDSDGKCELLYNDFCDHKLSQTCCLRLKTACSYHRRPGATDALGNPVNPDIHSERMLALKSVAPSTAPTVLSISATAFTTQGESTQLSPAHSPPPKMDARQLLVPLHKEQKISGINREEWKSFTDKLAELRKERSMQAERLRVTTGMPSLVDQNTLKRPATASKPQFIRVDGKLVLQLNDPPGTTPSTSKPQKKSRRSADDEVIDLYEDSDDDNENTKKKQPKRKGDTSANRTASAIADAPEMLDDSETSASHTVRIDTPSPPPSAIESSKIAAWQSMYTRRSNAAPWSIPAASKSVSTGAAASSTKPLQSEPQQSSQTGASLKRKADDTSPSTDQPKSAKRPAFRIVDGKAVPWFEAPTDKKLAADAARPHYVRTRSSTDTARKYLSPFPAPARPTRPLTIEQKRAFWQERQLRAAKDSDSDGIDTFDGIQFYQQKKSRVPEIRVNTSRFTEAPEPDVSEYDPYLRCPRMRQTIASVESVERRLTPLVRSSKPVSAPPSAAERAGILKAKTVVSKSVVKTVSPVKRATTPASSVLQRAGASAVQLTEEEKRAKSALSSLVHDQELDRDISDAD